MSFTCIADMQTVIQWQCSCTEMFFFGEVSAFFLELSLKTIQLSLTVFELVCFLWNIIEFIVSREASNPRS